MEASDSISRNAGEREASSRTAFLFRSCVTVRKGAWKVDSKSAAAAAKTLLIVEDEILLAIDLQDELEDSGYRVLELTTRHQEALGVAREGKPDLALVNICLDGGDDGVALARDLKALGVPVLFISGQNDQARLAKSVAVASLCKPYSAAEMVRAVDYLFRHDRGDDSRPAPRRLEVFDVAPPN